MSTRQATATVINGIDVEALQETMREVVQDPAKGIARFGVTTAWKGGTRSETSVNGWELGGRRLERNFTIPLDEPPELLGSNSAPNPQECLMAGVNACLMATFVATCAMEGIELESLSVETHGELDLRGFLGLDREIKPGYDRLECSFHVKGTGSASQYERVLKAVAATSPNYWNMANPVHMNMCVIAEQQ